MHSRKSFTLVEMLIVIVIIGILAAALIPRITGIQARSRDTTRIADARELSTAMTIYGLDHADHYPSDGLTNKPTEIAHTNPSRLVASLGYLLASETQTPGTTNMLGESLSNYIISIPRDPTSLGAQANPDTSCNPDYRGDHYAYYTRNNNTAYAITIPLEKTKGNTTNCGGKIDTRTGSYKVVGEGLEYTSDGLASAGDTPYPPASEWTDPNCFVIDGTTISDYKSYYYIDTPPYKIECPRYVVIPNDMGITEIGNSAFGSKFLTGVVLPDTLESIGNYAFASNNISEIDFPNNLTSIGDGAFRENSIFSVIIPNNIITIGQISFQSNKLQSIVFEDGDTDLNIGKFAFSSNNYEGYNSADTNTNIGTTIKLGNRVKKLLDSTFSETPVINLDLGEVEEIGYGVFINHKITKLNIPSSVETIGYASFYCDSNKCTINNNGKAGYLSELTIEYSQDNHDLTIGQSAFGGNSLTVVNLPASVKSVGPGAFHGEIQGYLDDFEANTVQKRLPAPHHHYNFDIWTKQ